MGVSQCGYGAAANGSCGLDGYAAESKSVLMERIQHEPTLRITASANLDDWLAEHRLSLLACAPQVSKLLAFGTTPQGRPALLERTVPHCSAVSVSGSQIHVAGDAQIWYYEQLHGPKDDAQRAYDTAYSPRGSVITGSIGVRDLSMGEGNQLHFVTPAWSCLATVSDRYSFDPLWQPPFVTDLTPETRCGLSGLAMQFGQPKWVTCFAASNNANGWQGAAARSEGGLLIDVESGETVCGNLSLPISPRWHGDLLWLLNSGRGEFGYVKRTAGEFVPVLMCPGYPSALTLWENYAFIALSRQAEPLADQLNWRRTLRDENVEPWCGVWIIDLDGPKPLHWLKLEGLVNQITDLAVLPNHRRPYLVSLQGDQIRQTIHLPPQIDAPPQAAFEDQIDAVFGSDDLGTEPLW